MYIHLTKLVYNILLPLLLLLFLSTAGQGHSLTFDQSHNSKDHLLQIKKFTD